jgi:hypothetical protein
MSYQFVHEETYGRKFGRKGGSPKASTGLKKKLGIGALVAEAIRAPGATPHIYIPEPPAYLFGDDLQRWCQAILEHADHAKDRTGRKLRIDRQIISAGIASFPMRSDEYRRLPAGAPERLRVEDWMKNNIAWLLGRYEEHLGPILLHLDEEFVHIHYYVAPEVVEHEHGYELVPHHPGYRAKREAADNGAKSKEQNRLFNDAMRAFQEDYWKNVGLPSGLTKTGPKRRRLSRADYKKESSAAMSTRYAQEHATALADKAELNAERRIELIQTLLLEEAELHYAHARMDGYKEGLRDGANKGHHKGFQSGFKRGIKQGVEKGITTFAGKRNELLLAISERFDPVAAELVSKALDSFLADMTTPIKG